MKNKKKTYNIDNDFIQNVHGGLSRKFGHGWKRSHGVQSNNFEQVYKNFFNIFF